MNKKITIRKEVRTFCRTKPDVKNLNRTGGNLQKNMTITISGPHSVYYDHRIQQAYSFDLIGRELFILIDELGPHSIE